LRNLAVIAQRVGDPVAAIGSPRIITTLAPGVSTSPGHTFRTTHSGSYSFENHPQ